jgi:hypothetical protein
VARPRSQRPRGRGDELDPQHERIGC